MKFKIAISVSVLALSVFMYSCKTASYYFNKAEKQYGQGEYAFAIENYQQALGKGADKKECNYKLAESHRRSNRIAEAGPFYKAAIDAGTTHETSYLYYGLSLKAQGKYSDAMGVLNNYVKSGSNKKVKKRASFEAKKIAQIDKIPDSKIQYQVENFEQINNEGDDYGPTFLGEKIVFASSRGESKTYGGTGYGFSDLYTFKYDDINQKTTGFVGKLDETGTINQDYTHEAEATFSPDGETMVFARGNDGSKKGDHDVQLFMSKMQPDGNWSAPVKLDINDPEAWNGCPKFSNNGNFLYFGSNRRKGRGGIDIYQAEYKDGKFLHVKNMGSKINSVGNDMFPYEAEDGTFYFSSDGHVSYGGLDLFKAERDAHNNYKTDAVNLGKSINTAYDDFAMSFDGKGKGFFCSNRPNGKGRDDIYKFKEVIEPYYFLNAIVKGENGVLLEKAKLSLKHGDEVVSEDFTDSVGEFHIKLKKDFDYTILAQKDHYFTGGLQFTVNDDLVRSLTKNENGDYVIPEIVQLNKIVIKKAGEPEVEGVGIALKDIFYDLGSAEIRDDAKPGLNKVVKLMKENPGITIELSSHTDSRDTDDKNLILSQKRAESAVNFIVSAGIDSSRIVAKGYGETKLINRCANGVDCSDEEHQANRRTEIAVTNVENTFENEHEKYKQSKLEEELERQRLEEMQHEMEEEEKRKHEEEEMEKQQEERKKEKEMSEREKYLEMKKKLEEMEKKFKEEEK